MEEKCNSSDYGQNNKTGVVIEKDVDGYTWVYQGKEHGYDSWYGIPPEE